MFASPKRFTMKSQKLPFVSKLLPKKILARQRQIVTKLAIAFDQTGTSQVGNSEVLALGAYSNRRISTGRIREADRAGRIVAAVLIARAVSAIHTASNPFA